MAETASQENLSLHAAEEMIKSDPNTLVAKESWIAFKQLNDEMKNLQQSHEALKREFVNLQLTAADLRAELARKNNTLEYLTSEQVKPEPQAEEEDTDVEMAETASQENLEELTQKYKRVSEEYRLEKERNESLFTTLQCSDQRMRFLESAVVETAECVGILSAGLVEQEIKLRSLRECISRLHGEVSSLRAEFDSVETTKILLRTELLTFSAEKDRLKQALEELDEDLAATSEVFTSKSDYLLYLEQQVKDATTTVLALRERAAQDEGRVFESSRPSKRR
eukprot:TRINITY_DN47285_c0_g1_i1.p1 TRINITY_DN47285_c0_g1~~TRINITY_DN47285_c0_g1_i1.p1  ORF type:complete len:298 (-),score=80.86 TRINITY_DN47285_c0_g1_i1:34-876(-)